MSKTSDSVLAGQKFQRIIVENPDTAQIFPIDVGTTGIAVGPRSDFATYEIYYPDSQSPSGINSAIVTPERPWLNPLSANLVPGQGYPPPQAGMAAPRGEILVFLRDFQTNSIITQSTVDLVVYTASPPQTLPKRAPNFFTGPIQIVGTAGALGLPFFGRKSFELDVKFWDEYGANSFDLEIVGVRMNLPYDQDKGSTHTSRVTLATAVGVTRPVDAFESSYSFQYDIRGQTDKSSFDYMLILITNATAPIDPAAGPTMGVQFTVEVCD